MNVLRKRRGRVATLLTVVAATALGLSACGSNEGSSGGGSDKQLNLVGFAVIKSAYDELGTSFAETEAGKGVTFKGSYGASGAQSRAVIAGQKADIVALSLSPDVKNIAEAGKIATTWDSDANKGIVSDSVVVIAVRKGNPKQIKAGTTSSSRASASSPPTRAPPARPSGTCWPPTPRPWRRQGRGRGQGLSGRLHQERGQLERQRPDRHRRVRQGHR